MYERKQGKKDDLSDEVLLEKFSSHLINIDRWIKEQPNIECLQLEYVNVIKDPLASSREMNRFLKTEMNIDDMVKAVDPALYRNRVVE